MIAIFLVVASVVGVLWFGSRLVISGEMTGGGWPVHSLRGLCGRCMAELAESVGELAQAAGPPSVFWSCWTRDGDRHARLPKALPEPPLGNVSFNGVHSPIQRGRRVGPQRRELLRWTRARRWLVGPAGEGRARSSTDLRFYDPQLGSVAIGGLRSRHRSAGAQIAHRIVPQEGALFDETILENIRYGRSDSSDAEVAQAAAVAQAERHLGLPQGYATRLGEAA